ncbi:hypothetical protein Tco_0418062 [Tanacetum coccineum]
MVAFLEKPAESVRFEQIVDFLNAHQIRYALTVNPTIYTSCIEQFWSTAKAKTIYGEVQIHALVDRKKVIITESSVRRDLQLAGAEGIDSLPNSTIFDNLALMGKPKRKDTEVPQPSSPTINVVDDAIYEEWDDSLVRVATTTASLKVEQDSGNILKTQSKATPNDVSSLGTTSGGGPKCQETMGVLLLKLALNLETTKTTQATLIDTQQQEIAILKKRVKKLERRKKSRTFGLKRLYRVGSTRRVKSSDNESLGEEDASKQRRRIEIIDTDDGISLVNDDDNDMFGVNDLDGDEVIVESKVTVKAAGEKKLLVSAAATITKDGITLAKALEELKTLKHKAKVEADYQLAEQLQVQEQVELTIKEKAIMFKELLEAGRKYFAAKRVEEKRNKPPTKAQQRKKVEVDKESEKLKQCLEIIPDDEDDVTIDATPLSTKSPTIVDYKIHKEGKKSYF